MLIKFPPFMFKAAHVGSIATTMPPAPGFAAFLPLEALCTALVQQSKQAHPDT